MLFRSWCSASTIILPSTRQETSLTGSIDMILCDLPYGTTDCDWDICIDLDRLWAEYRRIAKPNAAIVLTAQQPFATDLINAARRWFRYEIIWEKNNALGFLSAKKMPLRAHENILVFYRALPTYNPQMGRGNPYRHSAPSPHSKGTPLYRPTGKVASVNAGTRYPRSVQFWPQEHHGEHPIEKRSEEHTSNPVTRESRMPSSA